MRSVLNELLRRTTPWTIYPFASSSSARYDPSWPVIPVISAFLGLAIFFASSFRVKGPCALINIVISPMLLNQRLLHGQADSLVKNNLFPSSPQRYNHRSPI